LAQGDGETPASVNALKPVFRLEFPRTKANSKAI